VVVEVLNPTHPEGINTQVSDLLSIISSNLNQAEIEELSRHYKIPVELSLEHSFVDNNDLYDFFDYFPDSVSRVLDIPRVSISDFSVGAATIEEAMTVEFSVAVSEPSQAATIWNLLLNEQHSFTSALSSELQTRDKRIENQVSLETVNTMKVRVTVQADLPDKSTNTDGLVLKLELLGHEVTSFFLFCFT